MAATGVETVRSPREALCCSAQLSCSLMFGVRPSVLCHTSPNFNTAVVTFAYTWTSCSVNFQTTEGGNAPMRTPLMFSRPPTVVLSGSISVSAHLDSAASADINIYILESGQEILPGSWMLNLFVIFCCCLYVCALFPSQLFL